MPQTGKKLTDRFSKKQLLGSSIYVPFLRCGDREFTQYLQEDSLLVTFVDIKKALLHLGVASYNPNEWRPCIESSKRSRKCVFLLHASNSHSLTPICNSVIDKINYEGIESILKLIHYKDQHRSAVSL